MAAASLAVRVSAQIAEFQKAFVDAQRTVRGFEKDFAGVASSVQGHQQSMNRAFAQFSGDRVIGQAHEYAAAIAKVGGAAKLTESEQRSVNAVVTEAIAKYQALGQTAPKALTDLANATAKVSPQPLVALADASAKVAPQLSLADKAAGLLKSTFAQFTLANLAASAIQSLTARLQEFVRQGSQIRAVENSFNRLSAVVQQDAGAMLDAMQVATRGLVSNYDLMLSANKAMLLGLPVTAAEMGDLAKSATALGKAMGLDATTSVNDLITALGRSSPLILDNLGLTVKVGEANEVYAAKLGKSADALTDGERKLAFYQAAMEKARQKTKELGDQTLTLGEIMDRAWVRVGNIVSGVTGQLNVSIGAVLSSTKNFALFLQEIASGNIGMALINADLREQIRLAQASAAGTKAGTLAQRDYVKELKRTAETMPVLTREGAKQYEAAKKLNATVEELTQAFGLSALQQRMYEDRLNATTKATQTTEKQSARLKTEVVLLTVQTGKFGAEITRLAKSGLPSMITSVGNVTHVIKQSGAAVDAWIESYKNAIPVVEGLDNVIGKLPGKVKESGAAFEDAGVSVRTFGHDIANTIGSLSGMVGGGGGTALGVGADLIGGWSSISKAATTSADTSVTGMAQVAASLALVSAGIGTMIVAWKATIALADKLDPMAGAFAQTAMRMNGTLTDFQLSARLAGQDLDKLFDSDSPKEYEFELGRVTRAIQENERMMQEYGLTWRDFTNIANEFVGQTSRNLLRDFKSLTKGGVSAERAISGMSAAFSQLIVDAKKTGTKIPVALAPMLQDLIRSKRLSEDAARALLGIADDGVPALNDIRDAAGRYGLTLDQLGSKVRQLSINEIAVTIAADWETLIASGADANVIMGAMREKVQGVVSDALTMGLEIPESMRPVIEAMIAAGLLTDQFGVKLIDTSKLNFSTPLVEKIGELIDKLAELIDYFSKVGTAAEEGFSRARGAAERTGTAVPRGTSSGGSTGGTRSVVVGGEGTPTSASIGSGAELEDRSITVNTHLDGQRIASSTVRHLPRILDLHGV